MESRPQAVVIRNWKELSTTLRVSVAWGLLSGLWLLAGYHVLDFVPTGGSPPPMDSYAPAWFLLLISPVIGLFAAVTLTLLPMTMEKRGVVGFIAFVSSLPAIPLILSYLVV